MFREDLLGCLLCGGQSRRMGQDKAALTYQGQRWIDILLEKLSPICSVTVCSFRDPDQAKSLMIEASDRQIVYDKCPGEGPLGAWLSVFEKYPQKRILSVPVDMPLIEKTDLQALAQMTESGYIVSGNDSHYLLSHLTVPSLKKLSKMFEGGYRQVEKFWDSVPAKSLKFPANPRFQNFNFSSDLEGLRTSF